MAYQAEREEIESKKFVDYKDIKYLMQFVSQYAKIMSRKRTGVSSAKQREIALAIKRARYMALMPYLNP